MAGTIGGVSCDIVEGRPRGPAQAVETWMVPGHDGTGVQTTGKHDSDAALRLVKYDTAANVETWLAAIEALQGTAVTLVNDWGDSYTNVLIRQVRPGRKRAALHGGGLANGVRGEIFVEALRIS